ncbi:MAG: GNAT family N-acetyltransferase [Solirubrobacteraceae bacterium]
MPSPESGLQVAHTADLDPSILAAARNLLYGVFGDEMTDHDWEHVLGGVHAIVWEAGELVGHGSVVPRQLLHGGRALHTGYVEGVAVRADRRRRGLGATVMEALERVVRQAYELGALGATEAGAEFYAARGWELWRGATWALTPTGRIRTEDEDDCVFVLPVSAALELSGELTCDWRDGDSW